MSPATTHAFNLDLDLDLDHRHHHRREINGLRPSPLRIHKDSHLIHKSSTASSSSNSSSSSSVLPPVARQQRPVIIYTQSPKIIHTKPQDFMALVQKLTGRTSSDHQIIVPQAASSNNMDFKSETNVVVREHDADGDGDGGADLNTQENSCLADFPLFTPTAAADFFCSPNKANPISPSFMEFLRGLPDY